jgi:hypothetical protein
LPALTTFAGDLTKPPAILSETSLAIPLIGAIEIETADFTRPSEIDHSPVKSRVTIRENSGK